MLTKLVGRVSCLFGRHERSRRLAYHDGDIVRSRCSHCGIEMERRSNGKWAIRSQDG